MKTVVIILIILMIAAVGVIVFDSNRFVVRKMTLEAPDIKEETTFLFISDLHNRRYGKENRRLIKALDNIKADAVLLPGDAMTASKNADFSETVRILDLLNKRMPVFYSYGNHESRTRERKHTYGDLFERYEKALDDIGVKLSDNESAEYKGMEIKFLTLPEHYYFKRGAGKLSAGEVESLVGKKDPDKFTILLAHDPVFFDAYVSYGADLTLSGHYHGGIVRLFGRGLISPRLTLFPKYSRGLYEKNGCRMLVSAGLGGHTIPWRMFNPAEMTVLTIRPVNLQR